MAGLIIPHSFTAGQTEPAVWLNDNFAAIAAIVNALTDVNIAPGAGIQGTKLADAPNGVPTGKIDDLAVTTAKLALGATVAASIRDPEPPTTQWVYAAPGPVLSTLRTTNLVTTRTGFLVVCALVDATIPAADTLALLLNIDGVQIAQAVLEAFTVAVRSTLTLFGFVPALAAGAHAITVTGQTFGPPASGGTGQTFAFQLA